MEKISWMAKTAVRVIITSFLPIFLFELSVLMMSLIKSDLYGVHESAWRSDIAAGTLILTLIILGYQSYKYWGKNILCLIIVCTVIISCKKEQPPAPASPGVKQLTSYEQCFKGDWLLVKQEAYDMFGTVYATSTSADSTATHYVLTDQPSAACDQLGQWFATVGDQFSSTNTCWSAADSILIVSNVDYKVLLIQTDSMIFRYNQPGQGVKYYLHK